MGLSTSPHSIASASWDVVVIGSGAAGLMACLEIPTNLRVLLLNRNTSHSSSSRWAQGGIAAVTRIEDSIFDHAEDTCKAGAGLCDGDAVRMFVEQAPKCVEHLQTLGMEFDLDSGQLATTLEAAHSRARVLHVEDRTGRALVDVLNEQVEQRPNVIHQRGIRVTQLLLDENHCRGVQVLHGPFLYWITARAVVLATGGASHLYANTTNPTQACGEGLAIAWKAGAAIQDLEFVQFHPTALHLESAPCFLITEALRGEGAFLVDQYGKTPLKELTGRDLAPRDQVSRALVSAMTAQGVENMFLDLKGIPAVKLQSRFPTILQRCREFGLDPLKSNIPVAPAAHYWMGGVATDLQAATSLKGLYAVGEVACTGLHGANRLASNSLMECLVFARQLSSIELIDLPHYLTKKNNLEIINCSESLTEELTNESLISSIEALRQLCWQEAGVKRSGQGMQQALTLIKKQLTDINRQPLLELVNTQTREKSYCFNELNRKNLNLVLDLSNRLLTSSLLLNSCLFREESRGGHYRLDFPKSLSKWKAHSRYSINAGLSIKPIKP